MNVWVRNPDADYRKAGRGELDPETEAGQLRHRARTLPLGAVDPDALRLVMRLALDLLPEGAEVEPVEEIDDWSEDAALATSAAPTYFPVNVYTSRGRLIVSLGSDYVSIEFTTRRYLTSYPKHPQPAIPVVGVEATLIEEEGAPLRLIPALLISSDQTQAWAQFLARIVLAVSAVGLETHASFNNIMIGHTNPPFPPWISGRVGRVNFPNPQIRKVKGVARMGSTSLRDAPGDVLSENLFGVGPWGVAGQFMAGFLSPETYSLYLLVKPESRDLFRAAVMGERQGGVPVFPQRMPIGSKGSLAHFWKHPLAKKVAAAVQYFVDEDEAHVVITHMDAKPAWRRQGAVSKLIGVVKRKYPDHRFFGHELTDSGRAFMESTGAFEEWGVK